MLHFLRLFFRFARRPRIRRRLALRLCQRILISVAVGVLTPAVDQLFSATPWA